MIWNQWEDELLFAHQFYEHEEIATVLLPHRTPEGIRKRRALIGAGQLAHCKKCAKEIPKHTNNKLCRGCQKEFRSSASIQSKYYTYRKSAAKRNLEWGLSLQEFVKLWNSPCTYCDGKIYTIGVDRIDNTKGYIAGNVCSCCTACNSMKGSLAVDEWMTSMKNIIAHYAHCEG